ncbi:uncharacterized protein N7459_002380 [Penicillium hispanicum]|uniref:uncharacterized protein n=1 Tax=Penicillium hispanicum TaxID=1080232 RepID=UPI002541757A|nr:uncharacterized protein N7459_002380 [Penicillium hispanicum]KAJ5592011.1 hypothetical protein N7459_002380 [Penicillium hispanicum]
MAEDDGQCMVFAVVEVIHEHAKFEGLLGQFFDFSGSVSKLAFICPKSDSDESGASKVDLPELTSEINTSGAVSPLDYTKAQSFMGDSMFEERSQMKPEELR